MVGQGLLWGVQLSVQPRMTIVHELRKEVAQHQKGLEGGQADVIAKQELHIAHVADSRSGTLCLVSVSGFTLMDDKRSAVQVRANSLAGYNLRGNGAIDRINNVEQVCCPVKPTALVPKAP